MPLWVLVIIVAAGLTLVIGTVHVFGGKRAGSLDQDLAKKLWHQEHSEDEIASTWVSDDRMIAIIALENNGTIGLVRQMGAHHIARRLDSGSVNRVSDTDGALDVWLTETTLPRIRLTMSDDQKRFEVRAMLEKLATKEGSSHA